MLSLCRLSSLLSKPYPYGRILLANISTHEMTLKVSIPVVFPGKYRSMSSYSSVGEASEVATRCLPSRSVFGFPRYRAAKTFFGCAETAGSTVCIVLGLNAVESKSERFRLPTKMPPPTNSNESYCTFTLASDVTAGGLPSEDEIRADLENTDPNVSSRALQRSDFRHGGENLDLVLDLRRKLRYLWPWCRKKISRGKLMFSCKDYLSNCY